MKRNDTITKCAMLRFVPRFQTTPCLKPQSVAEHSFRVAVAAGELARGLPEPFAGLAEDVYRKALLHDMEEAYTGDLPKYTKTPKVPWGMVELIVKIADAMDACMYVYEEKHMGNDFMYTIQASVEYTLRQLVNELRARLVDKEVDPEPVALWIHETVRLNHVHICSFMGARDGGK